MPAYRGITATVFLQLLLLAACGGHGVPSPGDGDASTAVPDVDGGSDGAASVCPDDLVPVNGTCVERREPHDLGPGWNEIKPGGDTLCVDGDEFAFYVRKGSVNKMVFFMQGGGACWDAATCLLPIYNRTVSPPGESGILDADNPDNPFRDWHVVYVPYCSADVSFGNVDQRYLVSTVHHRGFVNAEAVRHWVYDNLTAPEQAFVSGCSAGAVGVIMHGAYLAEAYKENTDIRASLVTDSFQGLMPDGFSGLHNWNFTDNVPPWLPQLKEPPFNMTRAILEGAPHYPNATIAHFNYANDAVQSSFYAAMGGNPLAASDLIAESMHTLAEQLPNYRYYVAPGSSHCVFERDEVFTTEVAGINLAQWLGRIAAGEDVPNVE